MHFASLCLAAALLPAAFADDSYLFVSFRGNGEDGLHYALSPGGYHWTALAGDTSWLKPKETGELMRDPFLTRGPDGVYHLIWTWGWYRDAKGLRRRRAALLELGVRSRLASNTAGSGRGPWYLAKAKALSVGLSNAYFKSLGLPSLLEEMPT